MKDYNGGESRLEKGQQNADYVYNFFELNTFKEYIYSAKILNIKTSSSKYILL